MTALPDIPRLYTALAECLAALLYARSTAPRFHRSVTLSITVVWAVVLAVFLQVTGSAPRMLWIPCMAGAIALSYLYLWITRSITLPETGYHCARAFILAELAASVEWQLHCVLWPHRPAWDPLSVLLLAVVYAALFASLYYLQYSRQQPAGHLEISGTATLIAVMLALTAFAVSNLSFLPDGEATMSMFSIRTLVDFSGVLILTIQHDQLREAALHSELAAMDAVLHRQYEQYKRSKEGINLINRRYHELKIQLATIREERDQAKQNAALAAIESNIRQYEAENKTGNPVLDTILTAKSMECQQSGITMTSVADGRMLGFLTTRELCTIVGVALDNAIAAVRTEPDPEKRLIKVAVYAQSGFVMLRFEHYTETPPVFGADGLPEAGAPGSADLKSVQTTVQQHGGSMTLHYETGWYSMRVLLPLPQDK